MSSNRPYLLRAVYEWILDNQCTPHLLVDARDERVKVPREHVRDGQIVLNINPSAVGQFHWDNEHLEFSARFGGVARSMWIPLTAILAIYARENGEGMAFTSETEDAEAEPTLAADEATDNVARLKPERTPSAESEPPEPPTPPKPAGGNRSHLKVIK
ncbi:ClpXP protease specificity-enhancing factor [Permianibacter sp. IMCC34836]|uniref:ClpXP protease specificity-enhancing factor n=1 Tax=Permianibacter fluminis TaxID=2738515 RepID=UPI00155258EB|nr:ClpXP protease specificity-enhancing factor [Permianibacter fluminis]NQD39049.1 ClpXP protease specificity-enhancing factor [Permianibacter fluminis]